MERLTMRTPAGGVILKFSGPFVDSEIHKRLTDLEKIHAAIEYLAEIEDILGDYYNFDRFRELMEADRDGRCVVLPCHIGDPVFMGTGRAKITGYEEDICDGFYIGRNGILQVKAQNNKGNHGTYGVIGQTAELTREAAEAALKGEAYGG